MGAASRASPSMGAADAAAPSAGVTDSLAVGVFRAFLGAFPFPFSSSAF